MALKKDKQKVLGEVFNDERVRGFLNIEHSADVHPDYAVLERAYRGMKIENFETLVKFFCEDGRDLNATNAEGKTLLQVISSHRLANQYVSTLKDAGAKY